MKTDMSTGKPDISVCIANYNGMTVINDCLQSILAQSSRLKIEILVHDDCSTDGSVEYVRAQYPMVKLIQSRENVGFCVSNNRMADAATSEYLLFLNNDAALFPDALETLYRESQQHGHKTILGLPQYDAETKALIDMGSRFDIFLNPVPNKNPGQTSVGMIIGACLWVPRSIWTDLGGFPDWFHTLAEDMYLCCFGKLNGNGVKVLTRSGFYHWVGKSIGGGKVAKNKLSTSLNRRRMSERNKTYVMFLCYPFPLFQIVFSLHIHLLILEGICLSIIKRDIRLFVDIYLFTILSLWKNRDMLVRLRRKHQMRRAVSIASFFKPFDLIPYKLKMLLRYGMPEIDSHRRKAEEVKNAD